MAFHMGLKQTGFFKMLSRFVEKIDANGDGAVDIHDVTHLQKFLAEFDVVLGKA